jgi:hypothetical protein
MNINAWWYSEDKVMEMLDEDMERTLAQTWVECTYEIEEMSI